VPRAFAFLHAMTKPAKFFVALYPSDFLADIGHLGNTELGVYMRLLLVYYRDQRPLPVDPDRLRRLAMTFSPEESKVLESVVSEFFTLTAQPDGTRVWRHKRVDEELERANSRIDNKRAGAAKARAILEERKSKTAVALARDQLDDMLTSLASGQTPDLLQGDELGEAEAIKLSRRKPASDVPPCPSKELIELYAKHLPELPQPIKWDGTRAKHMRDRWRWVLTAKRADESRYASTVEEGMAQFDKFFRIVAMSDFLTGRDGAWANCDLAWLMKEDNFTKVIEGKYRNKEKA